MRFVPIFSLLLLFSVPALAAEPDLAGVDEKQIMIPMRDGVKLSAWIYLPQPVETPLPVVFEQRYASLRANGTRESAARLARGGYIVALVNYRGTHDSEGKWVGYRAMQWGDLRDGYDVCEWLATQSWCDGKVGTFGSSQGGYAQNYLAVTQPPHLVCQYMIDTGLSLFHEGYRIGGTTRPGRFSAFGGAKNPQDNIDLLAEWYRHPHYDDYWKDEDASLHFDKMNVPCFTIGSWFDFMNQGSIASFIGRQHKGGVNSRGNQWLAIGPWLHGRTNKGHQVGELKFPKRAAWPVEDHMIRWFDHWLKGKPEAADVVSAPPVRYFAMGAVEEAGAPGNVWRDLQDWPPKAQKTSYFLNAEGTLSETCPDENGGATSFQSDPRNPMEIPGRSFPGARDARSYEEQPDLLTFTTAPLEKPVEWTGRIFANLYVKSTAPDTDIIVRVSDVYPDGRSMLLVDYPWRMRYREGLDREVLMTPGEVHSVKFPVGWISQVFNRGHRIRVTISSTGAPLYEPNPQNGKPLTLAFPEDAQSATNTILHCEEWPSQIIAPTGVITKRPEYVLDEASRKIQPDEKRIYKKIDGRELEMHLFHPEGHDPARDRRPAFLFIHGGGWAGGEPLRFYSFARHFADLGMVTASIQYRLWDRSGKGNTVFDCVKDGRSAVRYLRENAAALGIDPDKIAISGGSAGGHVAVSAALFDEVNESTDNLEISCRPDLMVLLNPVIDTSDAGYGKVRIGERWKELSPVHHVKSGLPPTIIFHPTGDQVVPYLGSKQFHEASLKLGNESELVDYEGGWHGYFIFDLKLYDALISRTENFLRSKTFLE
ncbi:MAG: CocE/NonD family hydrolase [Verrucomicrobiales bacterium]|nr:CocE/NonD family hydrolase [Verrucomicrobiales bacterium]